MTEAMYEREQEEADKWAERVEALQEKLDEKISNNLHSTEEIQSLAQMMDRVGLDLADLLAEWMSEDSSIQTETFNVFVMRNYGDVPTMAGNLAEHIITHVETDLEQCEKVAEWINQ